MCRNCGPGVVAACETTREVHSTVASGRYVNLSLRGSCSKIFLGSRGPCISGKAKKSCKPRVDGRVEQTLTEWRVHS